MTVRLTAFFDEIEKIAAQFPDYSNYYDEMTIVPHEERGAATWPKAKRALTHALVGGAALGLGTGLGSLAGELLTSKVMPHARPEMQRYVASLVPALTAAGGFMGAATLAHYKNRVNGVPDAGEQPAPEGS